MLFHKTVQQLNYDSAVNYFSQFPETVPGFLLESVDIAPIYGRLSLMSIDPPFEVIGQAEQFVIRALNKYGEAILQYIPDSALSFCTKLQRTAIEISGYVPRQMELIDESQRQQ